MSKEQQDCRACGGTGYLLPADDRLDSYSNERTKNNDCSYCGGSGKEPVPDSAMRTYTCNVIDPEEFGLRAAHRDGYKAYAADGVTAVEIKASSAKVAGNMARRYGRVSYVFE